MSESYPCSGWTGCFPGVGLLVLSIIAVLNIDKPWGLTGYGPRHSLGGFGRPRNADNGER